MYPVVFEFFGFQVSSFGVMLAVAFLAGTWLTARRMAEMGLDPEGATTLLIYAMVGGIGGSKLY
ncbi:MAG TPA: prolipoprotein diacylglyceryl transferase family protein, partial [Myxococcota bacterium]